jgi:hypothetical protein
LSLYALQKLIRAVDTQEPARRRYFAAPEELIAEFDIAREEKTALLAKDFGALYRMGVHGLLLRPFSILQGVSEKDYLAAIRGRAA